MSGKGTALGSLIMKKNSGIYIAKFFIKAQHQTRIGVGIEEALNKDGYPWFQIFEFIKFFEL